MNSITPGTRVYWTYLTYGHRPRRRVEGIATVLTVHPRTAHIQYRRRDGRLKCRWVKLSRLEQAV